MGLCFGLCIQGKVWSSGTRVAGRSWEGRSWEERQELGRQELGRQELGTKLGSPGRAALTVIHLSSTLLLYCYCVDKTVSMCGCMNV